MAYWKNFQISISKPLYVITYVKKKLKKLDDSNSAESFLVQPLWSNTSFKYKGKSLYFENWVKSGSLYVKDIFNENGLLKSSEQIIDILNKKSNCIYEYKIMQQVFKRLSVTIYSQHIVHNVLSRI